LSKSAIIAAPATNAIPMRPLAFVDLETTGATAANDRITEIGIVEVDADGTVREWQQLLNPGISIPPFIEQLTGISNAMVANAPSFEAVASEALRRLEGRLFIAHNAKFDYGFLKSEFKRLGITFRASVLCTVKLSRALFPEHKRHNLDSLIERHALYAEARHRALADAQLIHQFWRKIHVDRNILDIEAALQAQNANPSLPAHIDASIVDDLPESPRCLPVLWRRPSAALHQQGQGHPQTGTCTLQPREKIGQGRGTCPASQAYRLAGNHWRNWRSVEGSNADQTVTAQP
jgi:DNA polymerase III epsilon subunit family exonuclease